MEPGARLTGGGRWSIGPRKGPLFEGPIYVFGRFVRHIKGSRICLPLMYMGVSVLMVPPCLVVWKGSPLLLLFFWGGAFAWLLLGADVAADLHLPGLLGLLLRGGLWVCDHDAPQGVVHGRNPTALGLGRAAGRRPSGWFQCGWFV